MRVFTYIIAVVLALQSPALARPVPQEAKSFPVQYHGRMLPFSSFAQEVVLDVTGKMRWNRTDPSETVLDWMASPENAQEIQLLEVGFDPLREQAGLDMKRRRFSLNELLASRTVMQLGNRAQQIRSQDGKPSKIESEAGKVLNRMSTLYALLTYQIPAVAPTVRNPSGTWMTLADTGATDSVGMGIHIAAMGLLRAYSEGNSAAMVEMAGHLDRLVKGRWNPTPDKLSRFDMEVKYNRWRPIQTGRMLYLFALLVLLVSLVGWGKRLVPISAVLLWLGLLLHVGGLLMRWQIGDRAPWSNFYESLVTITAVLVLMGLLFAKGKLRALALGGVAFSGYAALMIADRAGLSPGVDTLVPALQSYWLTIHVIVILSGYAVAALAMVLGHVALGVETFKPNDRPLFIASSNAVYRAIQLAMLLLFAGTVLGGVWAHEAWGRYWGWDPKETWALISWFGYLGVAHARFAGWLKPRGMALAAIGVFPLILMTYYGVNYLLSGLHSYAGGESATIPPMLIGFLALEAVVVTAGIKGWHLKLNPRAAMLSGNGKVKPQMHAKATQKVADAEEV